MDKLLLGLQGSWRKAWSENFSHASVIIGINGAEEGLWLTRLPVPPDVILQKRGRARPGLENIVVGVGVGKGYLVGRDAQDGAVLSMQLLEIVHDGSL